MEASINSLRLRVEANRNEIHKLLSSNMPLSLIKVRIEMLSKQNESLIERIKKATTI